MVLIYSQILTTNIEQNVWRLRRGGDISISNMELKLTRVSPFPLTYYYTELDY